MHKSCTNTSWQIGVRYVKIFMHTQSVKLKHNGIWERGIYGLNGWGIYGLIGWGIYGSNGWGTYGKVSDCVLGDMREKQRSHAA